MTALTFCLTAVGKQAFPVYVANNAVRYHFCTVTLSLPPASQAFYVVDHTRTYSCDVVLEIMLIIYAALNPLMVMTMLLLLMMMMMMMIYFAIYYTLVLVFFCKSVVTFVSSISTILIINMIRKPTEH